MGAGDQTTSAQHTDRHRDATQLPVIGFVTGAFSSLFGVGGGAVMVPMLVFWRGMGQRRATGTSLVAITIVACYAVISYAIFGRVDVTKGILVGVPAVGGVLFGTWLQQKISERVLSAMFSILMICVVILYLTK